MNDFKKFKKKLMMEFYIKNTLVSAAGGMVSSGLVLMVKKMFELKFPWYYALITGIVIMSGIFIAIMTRKPDDEKIAERIDKEFHMQEKVTTMVTYKDNSQFMYEKQREDAENKLHENNTRKLPLKLSVLNIPALIFGGALISSSFFVPSIINHETNVIPGNKDDINNETEKIINDIRGIINNSEASEAFKAELNQILNDLLESLKDDIDINSRMNKIRTAEGKVDAALDRANSKEEFCDGLKSSKIDLISKLAQFIIDCDYDGVSDTLKQLERHFSARSPYSGDSLYDHISDIVDSLNYAMLYVNDDSDNKTVVNKDDTLYISIKNLYTSLKSINDKFSLYLSGNEKDGINEDQTKADTIAAIESSIAEINSCLKMQQENSDLADQVKAYMESLINPGGGSGGNSEDNNKNSETQNTDEENNGNNNSGNDGNSGNTGENNSGDDNGNNNGENSGNDDSGNNGNNEGNEGNTDGSGNSKGDSENTGSQSGEGASGGKGETKYGGNDKVYTDQNGYSEYGDVIDGYHNDAGEDNKNNGNDETGDILEDYFKSLYGSVTAPGDGNP